MSRQGWFSDAEDPPSATFRWQPCLQLDGWCLSIDVWFESKEDCDNFILTNVLDQPLLDGLS